MIPLLESQVLTRGSTWFIMLSLASAAFPLHHRSEVIHSHHLSTCLRKRRMVPQMWHKTLLEKYRWNYRCFRWIHSTLNISPVVEMCEKCKVVWWAVPLMHLFLVSPWMWYHLMVRGSQSATMCKHTPHLPHPVCQWRVGDCQYTALYHLMEFFFFQPNATYVTDGVGSLLVKL